MKDYNCPSQASSGESTQLSPVVGAVLAQPQRPTPPIGGAARAAPFEPQQRLIGPACRLDISPLSSL